MAAALASGCGARTIYLDGTDGGSINVNSNPDAIAPGVTVVVEDQESAVKIVVDDTRVYWDGASSTGDIAFVRSCLKTDCRSTVTTYDSIPDSICPSGGNYPLAAAGAMVAWSTCDNVEPWATSIWACPATGCVGAPRMIASPVSPTSMAMDESHIYWTSDADTAVFRIPLSGAEKPQAIALNESGPGQIALSGSHVYWIERWRETNATIKRIAKQGGETAVTLATGQNQPYALSIDSEFVYWATSVAAGSILRCPLSGCPADPTVVVARQNFPRALAVDGKSVFWMTLVGDLTAGYPVQRAEVKRCPIDSCESALETLAVQTFAAYWMSMAVDTSDLYWVAQADPEPINSFRFPHATIYRYAK
jgi:hypothetical protein